MEDYCNESRQTYIEKINLVQDYIENHLEEELSIQQLSRIASFSEYHFQRIFKQFTNESLYGFIKRLRLEKAIYLLRTNKRKAILDIALSVGFSNQASFAKALKDYYKMSANQIRKLKDTEVIQLMNDIRRNGKVLIDDIIYNKPVELNVQSVEPIKVLYIRYTGAYKGDSELFSKLFSKLFHYADRRQLIDRDTRWFVVYHDYSDLTADEKLRISICISVNQEVKSHGEFGCMELAGGRYAVGRFILGPSQYQGAWNYMISNWLPDSGYLPDDRFCYEYYPPQKQIEEVDTGRAVEIFIPVVPL